MTDYVYCVLGDWSYWCDVVLGCDRPPPRSQGCLGVHPQNVGQTLSKRFAIDRFPSVCLWRAWGLVAQSAHPVWGARDIHVAHPVWGARDVHVAHPVWGARDVHVARLLKLLKKQRENIRSRFPSKGYIEGVQKIAIFEQYLALSLKRYKIWPVIKEDEYELRRTTQRHKVEWPWVTLSEWQQHYQRRRAARDFFATAELLVPLTVTVTSLRFSVLWISARKL